jgi:Transcriptional regulatory protein, C terminal
MLTDDRFAERAARLEEIPELRQERAGPRASAGKATGSPGPGAPFLTELDDSGVVRGSGSVPHAGGLRPDGGLRRRVDLGIDRSDLSPREFELLRELAQHEGEFVPRNQLARVIWHREPDEILAMIIDAHVDRIDRKLERAGGGWRIRTSVGAGYCLHASPPHRHGPPDELDKKI